MNRERPWCVVRPAGVGYELRFGCGDTETFLGLVGSLKSRIDWHDRRFDPAERVWYVDEDAGRDLWDWIVAHVGVDQRRFVGVDPAALRGEDRRARTAAPPPPPPPGRAAGSPYDVLMLRPGAPPELVKAAYRILAQLHHPDRGGDHEAMVALNRAFAALGKGAA